MGASPAGKPRIARKGHVLVTAILLAALATAGLHAEAGFRDGQMPFQLPAPLVFLVICAALFALLLLLVLYLERDRPLRGPNRPMAFVFEEHPLLIPLILVLLFWTPWLLIAYPGTTDPNDTLDQLRQWHGMASTSSGSVVLADPSILVNNHHPILHTVLLNLAVDFGASAFSSQNAGLFLFVCLQSLALALALAGSFLVLREARAPYWARVLALLIFCLCPVYGGWAVCVAKDTLFTACLVAFVNMLMLFALGSRQAKSPGAWILFALVTLMTCLLRNNGILAVGLATPFMLYAALARGRSRAMAASGAAGLLASLLVLLVAYPALGFSGGSVRETLSVPFQQTARYVAYFGDELTEDEADAINGVLPLDSLADSYRPNLSDPVKNQFDKKATPEDLRAYFSAWAQMGLKHPEAYLESFLANTYLYYLPGRPTGWFWLNLNRYRYRTSEGLSSEADVTDQYLESGFAIYQLDMFQDARDAALEAYSAYRHTPVLSLPGDMAFCTWVLLTAFMLLLRKGDGVIGVLPLLPLVATFLVVLLGPQNGNIRYMLPIIFTMPCVLGWLLARYAAHDAGPRP